MPLIVCDTGPINYLVLIGHIDVLPILFERAVLPTAVQNELASLRAPLPVRQWSASIPTWIEMRSAPLHQTTDISLMGIDAGERAAIELAVSLDADLLLMDDRKGVNAAQRKGLRVTGTLGILDLAARRGLLDLANAFHRLSRPNFRRPEAVMQALLSAQRSGESKR